MTAYDLWMDEKLEEWYSDEEDEDTDLCFSDEPAIEPNNDYDNYDGWDDMQ